MLDKTVETFLAVAEHGSMNKAAAALYISPTAVMNDLNRLEARLGFPLFERSNRGLMLTKSGASLYQDALRLRSEAQIAVSRARQLSDPEQIHVRIGSSRLRAYEPFLEAFQDSRESFGPFRITVVPFDDQSLDDVFRSLGRDFDLLGSICDITNWKRHYQFTRLWDSRFQIAVCRRHPLFSRECLTIEDLFDQHILFIEPGTSAVIDEIRRTLLRDYPRVHIEDYPPHYDMGFFNRCAEEGILGLTVEEWDGVHPSLRNIPIDWSYTTPYGVLYPLHPSPPLIRFIEAIRAANLGHGA